MWRNACREIEAAARVDPVLDFLWHELKGVPAPEGDERLKESARKILANSFGSSFRKFLLIPHLTACPRCVSPVAKVVRSHMTPSFVFSPAVQFHVGIFFCHITLEIHNFLTSKIASKNQFNSEFPKMCPVQ